MKPIKRSQIKASVKALVDDLCAVRAVVQDRQDGRDAGKSVVSEARLFESWVIDRLAQQECQLSVIWEDLAGLQEEVDALRKKLCHPARKDGGESRRR